MIRSWFGRSILRLLGWKTRAIPHMPKKCIIIAHPHTSNWDFILFLLARWAIRVRAHWVGKHTLFRPPFGWIMRRLDGVPVNRSGGRDSVTAIAEVIQERDNIALGIAPSGSRSYNEFWRSGFYHIALKAKVPLVFGFIDYSKKIAGLGDQVLELTGDVQRDMDQIRAFYADMKGRYPEKQNPVRLRSELGTEEHE